MSFWKSNLGQRILSAVIGGIPILYIVYRGGFLFSILTMVIVVVAAWEWGKITEKTIVHGMGLVGMLTSVLSVFVFVVTKNISLAFVPLVFGLLLNVIRNTLFKEDCKWSIIGEFYLSLPIIALFFLRNIGNSPYLFLTLLLTTWSVDIGAYVLGRLLGGPKIAPKISPKKTWAGLIGGMIGAIITLFIMRHITHDTLFLVSNGFVIFLGIGSAIVGQIGDFFESGIKRKFNVKDSSNIIPGHGGILDRIDGLLAIAVFWTIIIFL